MSALIPLLVSSTVKTSVIILAAFLATALLRKRSAALRHGVLATALACAAILPVLERAVPAWDVRPPTRAAFVPAMSPWASAEPVRHVAPAPAPTRRVGALLAPAWVAGVALSLSLLGVGLARMTWLTLRSEPLTRGRWRELADATAREYRLTRHVLLLRSSHPTLLVTWGLLRPRIVLPATAAGWADDRMGIVLAHELAHIRRRDWAVQMGAELLRSVYWFNPLVWMACARLRRESEHACDDAVLHHGVEAAEYATQLMDLARRFGAGDRTWLLLSPRPEMARPSNLERRIRAMLNDRLDRTPPTRSARVAIALALSSLTLPLAGFGAAAQGGAATFSGSLLDMHGRILPDKPLVLRNTRTGATLEGRSDPTGQFTFTGLEAGEYDLNARVPGFATTGYRVSLRAGQELRRDVPLQIGSVQETISVLGSERQGPRTTEGAAELPPFPGPGPCSESPTGGCLEPPRKVRDVEPRYPQGRAAADATVVLEGRIGTDGFVKALRVLAPADPDFVNAALEAVSAWRFLPTRLNGVTVETTIKVTVNFKAR